MANDDNLSWWEMALLAAIGVGVTAAFVKGVTWLANEIKQLQFITAKQLSPDFGAQLGGHNVLVLGHKSAGKTALLWYMEYGRPMAVHGAGPAPTLGTVIIGKDFNINKNKWAKVAKDIPGDRPDLWEVVIEDVQPTGIIYMLNPRGDQAVIDEEINRLFSWVFNIYKKTTKPLAKPKVLHVFLNFADKWAMSAGALSNTAVRKAKQYTLDSLTDRLEREPEFASMKVDVAVTQLSPDAKPLPTCRSPWPEAKNAIDRFGADLGQ